MRTTTAVAIVLLPLLAGCDSRHDGSRRPTERGPNPQLHETDPQQGSTVPQSQPHPSLSLETARDLEARDPWLALDAYEREIAKVNAEWPRLGNASLAETRTLYLRDLCIEADELVSKVATPEYEAKVVARDMLSISERNLWQTSPGATYNFEGRELTIEGVPVKGMTSEGICSFGVSVVPPWHDIVIEVEFTILAGGFTLRLRYDREGTGYPVWFSPDANPATVPSAATVISAIPPSTPELRKPYRINVSVKGRRLRMFQAALPETGDVLLSTVRAGGVGFALQPGSKFLVTSCMVKVLR